ncbi:MAG: DNA polymerase I [Nitrospirota bacterium]
MNLYLIDGNSYVYRAFYAIKGLATSKGMPTNAVYGFTNMLMKIIKEKKPDGIVVSFDSPMPTERHRLFEAYKAHRPETPSDLVRQFPYVRKVVSAFNIKIFEIPGYEADDILCTIARKASEKGADVFIVTADKDMLQIVNDKIKIYDPAKDRVLGRDYVIEKFGVGPERVADFMGLAGDSADNIPGVKGIGEKTARELLMNFKDLEELLDHPEMIKKERLRALIAGNSDMARLSKRLATIDTSVPVDVKPEEFAICEPDWAELLTLFREFEFGSMMKLIPTTERRDGYETVLSMKRLEELASSIKGSFAFDVEATGRNPMRDTIVGLSICNKKGSAYYIPFCHSYPGAPQQLDKRETLRLLSPLFEDEDISKTGHNLKYDILMLAQEGVAVRGKLYDTMLAAYIINPGRTGFSLGDVAFEQLSFRKQTFKEVLGGRHSFSEVAVEQATAYAATDALLAYELREKLFETISTEGFGELYSDIEMPLIRILADIERAGFKVDAERLRAMSKELGTVIDSIQQRIYFLAGEEFNINSPKQLSRVLFHSLGFTPGKKTKTGFSTELSVLEELALKHELPKEILDYRSLAKLKSTYTDVLPGLINPGTGRIHTSFNQTATATGRLSSSDPNLQNIPVKGEWGRRMREAFISDDGNLLLSVDYSQIELRILAHLSGDEDMIDAFMNNEDIHSRVASEIFSIRPGKVTPEMRRIAKTVNFGIIYGMTPFGLSQALSISVGEAKTYIENYFKRHSGIKAYMQSAIETARGNGFVTTMFNRKRFVPEINSKNQTTRSFGERLAVNSPVQGSAADIIKIAMITIWNAIRENRLRARMILQVHDELVFELPESEIELVRDLVKEKMESAVTMRVPLRVEAGYGRNWAEAHG